MCRMWWQWISDHHVALFKVRLAGAWIKRLRGERSKKKKTKKEEMNWKEEKEDLWESGAVLIENQYLEKIPLWAKHNSNPETRHHPMSQISDITLPHPSFTPSFASLLTLFHSIMVSCITPLNPLTHSIKCVYMFLFPCLSFYTLVLKIVNLIWNFVL